MAILNDNERRTGSGRFILLVIYLFLAIGGAAMVYPFMVTLTGTTGTHFDYYRRSALPRHAWSREDRLMRTLCGYFPPSLRNSFAELRGYFPDFPEAWHSWRQAGEEIEASDAWALAQLAELNDPEQARRFRDMAEDLSAFLADSPLEETVLAYNPRNVAPFLREIYGTVEELNEAWETSVNSFTEIDAISWRAVPLDQQSYLPVGDARSDDLLRFRQAHREHRFAGYLRKHSAAIGVLRPAALAYIWEEIAVDSLHIEQRAQLASLPFPVPGDASAAIVDAWFKFLVERFPLRHIEIDLTPEVRGEFTHFLKERFLEADVLNRLMRTGSAAWNPVSSLEAAPLTAVVPDNPLYGKIWMDFVRTRVPVETWIVRETLPELAFQRFALARHGSLDAINNAYGLDLERIEQLRIPFRGALLDTFSNLEFRIAVRQSFGSYYTAADNLLFRGKAVRNTIVLVALTLFLTLTVNPMAAYAMSRFRLRHTNVILLFFVGTMAFPAAVSAIPGFLLIRDLGLINTFAALVLPTAANGMSIFLLKGFFDSLPQELYEAATIDGAREMQIFRIISLPLVKPILAVSALNAFIAAYNGWEWAILVAQDPEIWTLAVWTYQFSQWFASEPFVVMAAFVLNSLPVLLVFLFCQNIIMRGIILPQMK
jgi:ABC-type glycerol-3-phosphate transport system permease component